VTGGGTTVAVSSGVSFPETPPSNATTTYTLTVSNSVGATTTASLTLTAVAGPSISSFAASPNPIDFSDAGQTSTTLSYSFTGGSGSLSFADGGVLAVSSGGNTGDSPGATTSYTLTVENTAGSVATKTLTVVVQ
jgi:hypothetical protein